MNSMTAGPLVAEAVWESAVEYTKLAAEKGCDTETWALQLSSAVAAAGAQLPSTELADVLVANVCWGSENVPLAWKYIEKAITARLAPAPLVLALLSIRVLPSRHSRPVAFRLYMELIRRHMLKFTSEIREICFQKTMACVDDALHLSHVFSIQPSEPGVVIVGFVFCIVWKLLDAIVEDEGLQELMSEKKSFWATWRQDMEMDGETHFLKRSEFTDKMHKENVRLAIELVSDLLHRQVISRLLYLVREYMSSHWEGFLHRIHLIAMKSPTLRSSTVVPETLLQWAPYDRRNFRKERKPSPRRDYCAVLTSRSSFSRGSYSHGVTCSSLWIPLDLYLEDCIDGSVAATNAIEILSGLVRALHALNGTTWHDAFLGLWMASLRLVQRERDPIEGPVPRLDSRLCMLLSITTLSICNIIEEEEAPSERGEHSHWKEKSKGASCRRDLVSSLQMLGDYESLLVPPPPVIFAANQAAAKALMFISGRAVGNGYLDVINLNEKILNCTGNMRHLIVEACISRNLLDTSAYSWPGYVNGRINQIPHSIPNQMPSWSSFMKGAPLNASMVSALENTPASSLAELEKIFEITKNGSDEDKISAAIVLCGASLIRGWNIQEHTARFVVKLLSPPVPIDHLGSDSNLIIHAPLLNVILTGISSVDCVQVFSYHGLVPELAAALMAICEVFGSCVPEATWIVTGEEISAHTVFSNAFILLLRLWKFNHPPLEYCVMGDGSPVGSQLTPEYLLLLRNARLSLNSNMTESRSSRRTMATYGGCIDPIFVDLFPKLKVWYRQHQACLASTLSGLVPGTVHQNVDCLLSMMFRKINKGRNQSGPGTSGSSSLSSSSGQGSEDNVVRPKLPAWDIMEAVPFVVDAALTACAHGRLYPRELATGLKDLADFLPASLATIVSYFSAEVTRGVWKPAYMNGTDWPSPAANLSTVEELIKKIVAATGVDVPSLVVGGSSPAALPLPLAAFVSLTITYKLDKASERFLNLAGPALESLAVSCPWPSMPIVAALWTQKVKRWTDFLIFSASKTVFHHNNDAVCQLLRSCFSATLGLSANSLSSSGGVGDLLGHGFGSHFSGGLSPVAPGILYLRVYRCIKDVILLSDQILSLLMLSVKEIAESIHQKDMLEKLKNAKCGTRYGQTSFATAMTQVKVAAELGATFLWLSGGSGLVQSVIQSTLPSWFLSGNELDVGGGSGGMVYTLSGHALAYFTMLCAMFAWGISASPVTKRRPRLISVHLEFLASALDGKISLGCNSDLWRAYVSRFLGLIIQCAPCWLAEMESGVLKRLTKGLRQWNEEELALALLERGGPGAMGAAAELVIATL